MITTKDTNSPSHGVINPLDDQLEELFDYFYQAWKDLRERRHWGALIARNKKRGVQAEPSTICC